jgi:hypothetical protein
MPQADAYNNLSDIVVIGGIFYTGPEPVGRILSGVFSSSGVGSQFIDARDIYVRQVLDDVGTSLK